jgi:hypothetical protein
VCQDSFKSILFPNILILLLIFINNNNINIVVGRGVHRFLVGKPEGRRPLGRTRRRWEDNIKMDLQEVGGGCGD